MFDSRSDSLLKCRPPRRRWRDACRLAILAPALALGWVFTQAAAADDWARLAPADAAVYLQVDEPMVLFDDAMRLPQVEARYEAMLKGPGGEIMDHVLNAMGMEQREFIETYFGRTLVLIVEEPGDGKPGVLLTRTPRDEANRLRDRLKLKQIGQAGGFTLYTGEDGEGRIAIGDGWVAAGDRKHEAFIKRVLTGALDPDAKSLAKDQTYRKWTARLPAERVAHLFVRDEAKGETHAFALARTGPAKDRPTGMSLHWAGWNPQLSNLAGVTDDEIRELGPPTPRRMIGAMAVNMIQRDPQAEVDKRMQRLLPGKEFSDDILPKLGMPWWAILVGPDSDEAPSPQNSSMAIALPLKETGVAADLDTLMNNLALAANLVTMNWETSPVTVSRASTGQTPYTTADIGTPLAERMKRPELKALRPSFGRIGDWYVIAMNPDLFKRIAENGEPLRATTGGPGERVVANATLVGAMAGDMLEQMLQRDSPIRAMIKNAEQRERLSQLVPMLREVQKMRFAWFVDVSEKASRARIDLDLAADDGE